MMDSSKFLNEFQTLKKHALRLHLSRIRSQISQQRRFQAREKMHKKLVSLSKSYNRILSFWSMPQEIDTFSFNHFLASKQCLFLPRIKGEHLQPFHVINIKEQLSLCSLKYLEPIREACEQYSLLAMDCVLVPGMGFDHLNHRIGYGKGYYDRFITTLKELNSATSFIGIGFHEQFFEGELPRESHDQPLDEIYLF